MTFSSLGVLFDSLHVMVMKIEIRDEFDICCLKHKVSVQMRYMEPDKVSIIVH